MPVWLEQKEKRSGRRSCGVRDIDFLAEADARISAVRSGIGEEAWEEALRKGRAMTLDGAVSYAMEGEEEASG